MKCLVNVCGARKQTFMGLSQNSKNQFVRRFFINAPALTNMIFGKNHENNVKNTAYNVATCKNMQPNVPMFS